MTLKPAALVFVFVACRPAAAQQRFAVRDIGALPGYASSTGTRVNGTGQVAGVCSPPYRAFVWSAKAGMTDLGALADSPPGDLNDGGLAVGGYWGTYPYVGWAWTAAVGARRLPGYGAYGEMHAIGCNRAGTVVGYGLGLFASQRAFRWNPDLSVTDLGTLPGCLTSQATDVDDAGRIVGSSADAAQVPHAFVIPSGGQMTALPSLQGYDGSVALRIADSGDILGQFWSSSGGSPVAYGVWHSGQIVPLTGLFQGTCVHYFDISPSGWAVGTESSRERAWALVRDPSGGLFSLFDRLDPARSDSWLMLASANGVNAQGCITGMGRRLVNGQVVERAFLAVPLKVPQPLGR